ncbi:unnamed protein product [Ranitomeya imitator]|uniref:Cystatin LXN-type domain-containing protein n=1 Tax=Ranitomeya imitator TaxID=111125 RepID=A0ABN9LP31_9NEOB|nr:unnamed protein product [Ranitomeya imitator]
MMARVDTSKVGVYLLAYTVLDLQGPRRSSCADANSGEPYQLVPEIGRKYYVEFTAGISQTREKLGLCTATIFFQEGKPRPAINVNCSNSKIQKQASDDDYNFYKLMKSQTVPITGENIPDSFGYIEPQLEAVWNLANLGCSYVIWDKTTEGHEYNMAQIKSVKQVRCALHSSCTGCERRSAGKQSSDVTALLSGRCAHSQYRRSAEHSAGGQTAVVHKVSQGVNLGRRSKCGQILLQISLSGLLYQRSIPYDLYNLRLASAVMWLRKDNLIAFDYDLYLHERPSEEIVLCSVHIVWIPGKPPKVDYSCTEDSENGSGNKSEDGSAFLGNFK